MFGAVVSGAARHVRLPMKKDSASPTGQSPLPPPLEPETKKPKIGWKMKNVSRSTVPVRLLDFRGHREVRGALRIPCPCTLFHGGKQIRPIMEGGRIKIRAIRPHEGVNLGV